MIRRNKKSRMYHAPSAKVTHMTLESNFCQTQPMAVQVDELKHLNRETSESEEFYFEL